MTFDTRINPRHVLYVDLLSCTQNLPLTQKFLNIDEVFLQHTKEIGSRLRVLKCKEFETLQGNTKQITILYIKPFSTSVQCSVPILDTDKYMDISFKLPHS